MTHTPEPADHELHEDPTEPEVDLDSDVNLDSLIDEIEEACNREGGRTCEGTPDEVWEPPMVDQDDLVACYLESGQGLLALVKPLSITLIGGRRYRAALKIGLQGTADIMVTVLIEAAGQSFQPEGTFAREFEFYAEHSDPLKLPPASQPLWFACHAVEAWIDRLLQCQGLRETAIWGE